MFLTTTSTSTVTLTPTTTTTNRDPDPDGSDDSDHDYDYDPDHQRQSRWWQDHVKIQQDREDEARATSVGLPWRMTDCCKRWVCGQVKVDGSTVEGKTATRGAMRRQGERAASDVGWSRYAASV